MNRTKLNFWLDSGILLLFLGLLFTGLLMAFGLPHGIGRDITLWGLTRHDWGDIHFWVAVTFVAAIAVHFVLHWTWIRRTATSKLIKRPAVVALLAVIVAMAGAFVAAMASAPSGEILPEGEHRYEQHGAGEGTGRGMGMGWRRGEF